jgi:serine/threonine-protein kinase
VVTPLPDKKLTPAPSSTSNPEPRRFDMTDLDRIKRELAVYVGPMARIIVDRAAKRAASLQQLYELVSVEVPEGQERKRFLGRRRP